MEWLWILAGAWTLIAVWCVGYVAGQRAINKDLCKAYYDLGKKNGELKAWKTALQQLTEITLSKKEEGK